MVLNFHAFILKQLDIQPTEILLECSRVRCNSRCEKTDLVSRYCPAPLSSTSSTVGTFWTAPSMDVKVKFALKYRLWIFGSQELPEFFSDMNSALMPPPMNLGVMAWLKEQATATFVQGSDRDQFNKGHLSIQWTLRTERISSTYQSTSTQWESCSSS